MLKNFKISKAKIGDAQSIRKLEHKVWGEEVVNKYDIPMYIHFGYVYIAKFDDKIVGAITAYMTNKNEVYVCDLVVDKKFRGQKIGEGLYHKLLQTVKGKNIVSFLNPKNIPTLNLHKKLGAKIVAKVKNPYGLNVGLEKDTRLFIRIRNK